jgi:activating signal cointegrator 1
MAKALTIAQPYAHLISAGAKRVENRTWMTGYRGPLYIHAGKSRDWLTLDREDKVDTAYNIAVDRMAFGAIVALATLVDCVHIDRVAQPHVAAKYPWLEDHEHTSGPWCWILDKVAPIGPWPWRGAQGLFNVDEDELNRQTNEAFVTLAEVAL